MEFNFNPPVILSPEQYKKRYPLPESTKLTNEELEQIIATATLDLNVIANGQIFERWIITDEFNPEYLSDMKKYYIFEAIIATTEYYIQTGHIFAETSASTGNSSFTNRSDAFVRLRKERIDIMGLLRQAGVLSGFIMPKSNNQEVISEYDLANFNKFVELLTPLFLKTDGTSKMVGNFNANYYSLINVKNIENEAKNGVIRGFSTIEDLQNLDLRKMSVNEITVQNIIGTGNSTLSGFPQFDNLPSQDNIVNIEENIINIQNEVQSLKEKIEDNLLDEEEITRLHLARTNKDNLFTTQQTMPRLVVSEFIIASNLNAQLIGFSQLDGLARTNTTNTFIARNNFTNTTNFSFPINSTTINNSNTITTQNLNVTTEGKISTLETGTIVFEDNSGLIVYPSNFNLQQWFLAGDFNSGSFSLSTNATTQTEQVLSFDREGNLLQSTLKDYIDNGNALINQDIVNIKQDILNIQNRNWYLLMNIPRSYPTINTIVNIGNNPNINIFVNGINYDFNSVILNSGIYRISFSAGNNGHFLSINPTVSGSIVVIGNIVNFLPTTPIHVIVNTNDTIIQFRTQSSNMTVTGIHVTRLD